MSSLTKQAIYSGAKVKNAEQQAVSRGKGR
jgi:hypothetical protein